MKMKCGGSSSLILGTALILSGCVSDYSFTTVSGDNSQDGLNAAPSPTAALPPASTPTPVVDPIVTPTPSPTSVPSSGPGVYPSSTPSATPTVSSTPGVYPSSSPSPSPSPSASPSAAPTCTAGTTTIPLKIIFMVDASGSTTTTDPSCNYRCSTLNTFISNYGSNANLSYSFSYFNGSPTEWDMNSLAYLAEGKTTSHPFGGSAGLSDAVSTFKTLFLDNGIADSGTGYEHAFAGIETLITNDEAAGNKENYVVVFMSDGQPTDLSCNSGTSGSNCSATNAITGLVDGVLSAASANGVSQATVSAVYFGAASDKTSVTNLQTMATVGGGQFVNTNVNSNLVINNIITVPGCPNPTN